MAMVFCKPRSVKPEGKQGIKMRLSALNYLHQFAGEEIHCEKARKTYKW